MPQQPAESKLRLNIVQRYIVAAAAGIVILFWLAAKLGIVLFVALLTALFLRPFRIALERRRISRGLASFIALVLFLGVFIGIFIWIVRTIVPSFYYFTRNVSEVVRPDQLAALVDSLNLPPEIAGYLQQAVHGSTDFAIRVVRNSVTPLVHTLSGIVELIAVPFLAFYFLKDGARLRDMVLWFARRPEERPALVALSDELAKVLGGYIKGQVAVSLFSGAAVFSYFRIVGLPFAPVLASLAAVGELVPIVGPLAASAVAVALCLGKSFSLALKTAIFYTILLKLNHNLVSPSLIGRAIHLHPVVIMTGLLFSGHVFGVLGMVLAVPVMAVLRVFLREFFGRGSGALSPQGEIETGEREDG